MTLSQQWYEHRKQTHRDDESERLGDLLAAENDRLKAALKSCADTLFVLTHPELFPNTKSSDIYFNAVANNACARAALNGETGA